MTEPLLSQQLDRPPERGVSSPKPDQTRRPRQQPTGYQRAATSFSLAGIPVIRQVESGYSGNRGSGGFGGEGVEEPVEDRGPVGLVVAGGVVGLGAQGGSELDGGLVVAAAFADRLVGAVGRDGSVAPAVGEAGQNRWSLRVRQTLRRRVADRVAYRFRVRSGHVGGFERRRVFGW